MFGRSAGSSRRHRVTRGTTFAAVSALTALAVGACAPSTSNNADPGTGSSPAAGPSIDANFNLDDLIAAAKKEGPITIYDSSGDITEVAKAFSAKYGIKATGVKSKVGATLEKMTREAQANNITIDVTMYEDGPTLVGQLLPQNVVYTYVPGDLAKDIPEKSRNPLTVLQKANVWAYNTKLFPNGCPVNNVWDLVSPDWRGKIAMQDPLGKPNLIEYFTQLSKSGNDALKSAYQTKNGSALQTSEASAAAEWIKQLAKNSPILTSADEDVAAAVASPNQTQPRIGLMSVSKFRDVDEKGYPLGVCTTLQPWAGFQYPKYVAIATHTKNPNAAKLFVHFVLTEEGIKPETLSGGGISGNASVGQLGNSPDGLTDWNKQLFVFNNADLLNDFQQAQDMQDFWRLNHG